MSFDLAIWHASETPTADDAKEQYRKLCEGELVLLDELPAIESFYWELCSRFAEIDDWPEADIDNCPWSCTHDRSGAHVFVAMTHSSVGVAEVVVELAAKHGLVCHDPQGPDVYLPSHLNPSSERPFWRFWK